MGVSWVVYLPNDAGKSPSQTVEAMNQKILGLGAVKSTSMHSIECDVYQSMVPQAQQVFCYLMHNEEYPVTAFAILDSHTCLTGDKVLAMIMMKLKPMYDVRNNLKVECKGSRFELDDFVFKTGTVQMTHTKSDLGVLLEVEYLPSVVASNCYALLKDMLQGLVGKPVEIPAYVKLRGNDQYTPCDTMQQYLEHFNSFKKSHIQQGHMM